MSGILEARQTGSVSVLMVGGGGETATLLGPLEKANRNLCTRTISFTLSTAI
jgi:hypothetical protein